MSPATAGSPDATWPVRTVVGPAAELHRGSATLVSGPAPATRAVRILEASDRCVVLGSAEPLAHVDPDRLARAGMTVTKRRSGGGAVLVGPGEVRWVDVVVPAGDPLWASDVGRAGWWLGERWADALRRTGTPAVATWRGGLVRSAWSDRVCFAGLGPGEVTAGGCKVVGVSQRRTRAGVLFQCALLLRWTPDELLSVLALTDAQRVEGATALGPAAAGLGEALGEEVLEFFLAALDAGGPPPA